MCYAALVAYRSWCLPDKVELTPHQRKGNFDAVCIRPSPRRIDSCTVPAPTSASAAAAVSVTPAIIAVQIASCKAGVSVGVRPAMGVLSS